MEADIVPMTDEITLSAVWIQEPGLYPAHTYGPVASRAAFMTGSFLLKMSCGSLSHQCQNDLIDLPN
uniref:Uncharacterized protein n=1 Tax=Timema tahoe TaxID=61484 RepID=A0A7R9IN03_9NEOP|nr:unnamed protein product [Timema tahoe]